MEYYNKMYIATKWVQLSNSLHEICVSVRISAAVGYESSLDEDFLHLFKLVRPSARILVVHVAHSLVCGQLESVTVSEGPASGGKCPVVAHLDVFNASVQHPDVMT